MDCPGISYPKKLKNRPLGLDTKLFFGAIIVISLLDLVACSSQERHSEISYPETRHPGGGSRTMYEH